MPTITAPRISCPSHALSVVLRLEEGGPEATSVPVAAADLVEVASELWWNGFLRRGEPDTPLDELVFEVTPVFKKGSRRACAGFLLEASRPDGRSANGLFSSLSLQDVASRGADRLRALRVLPDEDATYVFELYATEHGEAPPDPPNGPWLLGDSRSLPLERLQIPVEPILARARRAGPEEDEPAAHRVFCTAAALQRAERFSRRGERSSPPVETGAVLVGVLCSATENQDMFCVVVDAIEATGAEGTAFSLSYSSKTWARIQAVLRARQTQPPGRAQRLIGQAHGHPFTLGNAPPCELCKTLKVCRRSSVFLSADDRRWCRCVFSRCPWQGHLVFGANARGEEVHGLFGQRDGRLLERAFHVIPDFVVP